jgi:hypothetical protein
VARRRKSKLVERYQQLDLGQAEQPCEAVSLISNRSERTAATSAAVSFDGSSQSAHSSGSRITGARV